MGLPLVAHLLTDVQRVVVTELALSIKSYSNSGSLGDPSNIPLMHLINDALFAICPSLWTGNLRPQNLTGVALRLGSFSKGVHSIGLRLCALATLAAVPDLARVETKEAKRIDKWRFEHWYTGADDSGIELDCGPLVPTAPGVVGIINSGV